MGYIDTQLFIDGKWQPPVEGKTLPVVNPATGKEIGRVAHAGRPDLDRALEAAKKGFEVWRDMVPAERSKIMRKAAALMRERAGDIAPLLTQEQGKPLAEAKGETLAAADIIEWFAEEGFRVYGRIVPSRMSVTIRQMVIKDPVGPVAAFTPWNFPINQIVRKVGAALAAGCSILVKAPEETPAAPAALIKAFADAGLPAGVLGLVYGNPAEISSYLIPHPVIRKVTFTGSIPVGKQLAALAGQHMKRVTMELGGHAPVIVCEDADIALAVKAAGAAKFRNAGQVCISPTRFLVHKSIAGDFAQALTEHAKGLKVGDGLAEGTQMGPLANPRRIDAMTTFTEDAVKKGAKLLTGGAAHRQRRQLLAADHPRRRAAGGEDLQRRAVRPGGRDPAVRHAGGGDRRGEPPALSASPATRSRKSLKNADLLARRLEVGMLWMNMPAHAVGRDALRRRQGFGLRLGGRPGGDGGVPQLARRGHPERLTALTRPSGRSP